MNSVAFVLGALKELSDLRYLDLETSVTFTFFPRILPNILATSTKDMSFGPVGLYVLPLCEEGAFSM